ncbi:hypothetical protein WG8_4336 [Paenibacillus sp. Aloe-11]|nr:hypothetical protein WG8_4336 [Paenibacillus sp. Aloe-11]
MGLIVGKPFQVFPNAFPAPLIEHLERESGRKIIGNKAASGTEILEELGEEHMKTGALIVYTSADSVLQIAAHEDIVPLDELYRICEIAREITKSTEYMVGRIIARPFVGEMGTYRRTANRHDYALKPYSRTVMNELKDANLVGGESWREGKVKRNGKKSCSKDWPVWSCWEVAGTYSLTKS